MIDVQVYFKKRVNRNAISAKITLPNQTAFEITTKISVPKRSDLNLEKGRILLGTHPYLEKINDQLYEFKKKVRKTAYQIEALKMDLTSEELRGALLTGEIRTFTIKDILRKYLGQLENGEVQNSNSGRLLAETTRKVRISHINSLISYVKQTNDLDLGKFNFKTSELIGINKVASAYRFFWKSLVNVMYKNNLDSNTIHCYSVTLKIVIRGIIKDSDLFVEPFLKEIKHEKVLYERILLRSKEYDFLIDNYDTIMRDCSITEKKTFQYAYVALWTCARSRDMKMWTQENLRRDGKYYWIDYITSKGNVSLSIPLKDNVVKIFEENVKTSRWLLPRTTTAMAPIVKTILKRYSIFGRTIKTVRVKGGKKVINSLPLWQILTIHKMRGSGMTAMRRNGVPDNVIKQWSSHTENSKAYSMYFQTEKRELLDTAKAFYG